MELPKGKGRQLLVGLLGLRKRFFSRSALVAAIDSWHRRPEQPLSRAVIELRTLDANQTASVDTAIQEVLESPGFRSRRCLSYDRSG